MPEYLNKMADVEERIFRELASEVEAIKPLQRQSDRGTISAMDCGPQRDESPTERAYQSVERRRDLKAESARSAMDWHITENGCNLLERQRELDRDERATVDHTKRRNAQPPTDRELEVLDLVCRGKSTKEIAKTLDITFKTANTHRYQLFRKADVHNVVELFRWALKRGYVSVED